MKALKTHTGTGPSNFSGALDHSANRKPGWPKWGLAALLIFAMGFFAILSPRAAAQRGGGQRASGPYSGPNDPFKTLTIRIDNNDDGMLYEPATIGPKARIAVLVSHPQGNNFGVPMGRELASRGYRVLAVDHHISNRRSPSEGWSTEKDLPGMSRGIEYLRTLPGVQRVIVLGHSGGGELTAFYADVAENGPSECQSQKIYPCDATGLAGLAKPDGVILLDATPGSFNRMQSYDPAVEDDSPKRTPSLDMLLPANGFDAANNRANYSPEFAKRFFAAQSARNTRIIALAQERLRAIEQGKSLYKDDEPFVIRGSKENTGGARLYNPDPVHYAARTHKPHVLLKADGSEPEVIVPSVRPSAISYAKEVGTLENNAIVTTVRQFLATSAIRTTPDFAITVDDIVGLDWRSAALSTPGNAEGIKVPSLVMAMTCNYLLVPEEIIYDHLSSKDKTFAAVEGALHGFPPCKPEYGDTQKRLFDFVDRWLGKPGRF
jgi:pimeloyl-ACP methyl ester carboxylesterase